MYRDLFKKIFGPKGGTVVLHNPTRGEVIKLQEVPDMVFAQKMIGEGFAINPYEGLVYSPVDGEVKTLFSTLHAIGLETNEGLEILIHIGIDTVDLNGKGFTTSIKEGDRVKQGDLLMNFDIDLIKENNKSPIIPVIITNMDKVKDLNFEYGIKDMGDMVSTVNLF